MTQPQPTGVDAILQAAAGNHALVTRPGLLAAVAHSTATPQQAATINTYVKGLQLEQAVDTARTHGQKLTFSAAQRATLDALGVSYSDVYATDSDVAQQTNAKLIGSGQQVLTNSQGHVLYGADGNPLVGPVKEKPSSGGFWHDIGHVLGYLTKPIQFAESTLVNNVGPIIRSASDLIGTTAGGPGGAGRMPSLSAAKADLTGAQNAANIGANPISVSAQESSDMTDAGYDPSNPLSVIAYRSSGRDYGDTSHLATQWDAAHPNAAVSGTSAVELAKQYLADPSGVMSTLAADRTRTAAQVSGRLEFVNSPQFQNLAKHVNATRANNGNFVMGLLHVDPVKHATLYRLGSAGIDLASAFAIDPLIVLGKVGKAAKVSQVGLGAAVGGATPERISSILLSDATGLNAVTKPYLVNVQRGTQRFLDNANQIRQVNELGTAATDADRAAQAAAYADIRATTPGWEPVLGDVTGGTRIMVKDGRPMLDEAGEPVIGPGDPITTMDQFADYLGSKLGLLRLSDGRASVESTLMPGALSAFGFRRMVKAPLAKVVGHKAGVSLERAATAARVLARPDDAIAADGRVLAAQASADTAQRAVDSLLDTGSEEQLATARATLGNAEHHLASERRAAEREFNSPERLAGEAQANLLRRGTIDGKGFNLARMMAVRGEQAQRRLSSFLPRNMHVDLTEASSTDKIYKFAQMFLNRGDSALLAARWAAADESARRTMIVGVQRQAMHAAGYGLTDAGRAALEQLNRLVDRPVEEAAEGGGISHRYSTSDMDVVADPRLGGQEVHLGVLPSDVRQEWQLPAFAEMLRDGARYSIASRTLGRFFTSHFADSFTHGIKYLWLFKPSTWTRNAEEGWLNAATRGEGGDLLRTKATIVESGHLPEKTRTKIAAAIPHMSQAQRWLAAHQFTPLADIAHAVRTVELRTMGDGDAPWLNYVASLPSEELEAYARLFSTQHMRADLDVAGNAQREEILRRGGTPAQLRYDLTRPASPLHPKERAGFKTTSLDGVRGAQVWQARLSHAVDAFPEYAKALLKGLNGEDVGLHAAQYLAENDPKLKATLNLLRRNSLVSDPHVPTGWREAIDDADRATAMEQTINTGRAVLGELMTGRDGEYLHELDAYITEHGKAPSVGWLTDRIPDEKRPATALAPLWIDKAIGPDGQVTRDSIARALANGMNQGYQAIIERPIQLSTTIPVFSMNYGKARVFLEPFEEQIAGHLAETKLARLKNALAGEKDVKDHLAVLGMKQSEFAARYRSLVGAGPDDKIDLAHMLEQRATTAAAPVRQILTDARQEAERKIRLSAQDSASAVAKRNAIKRAWVRTEQIVDDPGLRTQLDIAGRNFLMFSRAMQAMIRRWGQLIYQDPVRLEKMALSLNAAENSGFIYHDKWGELSFVYPGSAALVNGLTRVASVVPGLGNLTQLPITPTLTGSVLFAVPGLENPLRPGLSPLVNVPMRTVERMFPSTTLYIDQFDRTVNGPVGAGEIGGEFMPAGFRNLWRALDPDERNGQAASAAINAMANLIAADPDGTKGIVPPAGASPTQVQAFLDRHHVQFRNQLLVRWALGLFMPAAPSQPTEDTAASKPGAGFAATGVKNLRDEYTALLDDNGGDVERTNQLWAELHPDKLVYETARSTSTARYADLSATDETMKWMQTHQPFLQRYGKTAAYFVPESEGSFNDEAYQEQLMLGMRQKDTPIEFYNQVRVNQAGAVYWDSYDRYAEAVAKLPSGPAKKAIDAGWSSWSGDFKLAHPTFADSLEAFSTRVNDARDTLTDLERIAADPNAPSTVPRQGLTSMINAHYQYRKWINANPSETNANKARIAQVTAAYQVYMLDQAASSPALQKIYNAVFRQLDQKLIAVQSQEG